ncbi:hypothetical protein PR048_020616 [Dryococelus australis]|uniref:Uncharacterized protein n=1 Tax=Dryococelus australis TaxID=614101 RepID=A0ABQ9H6S6_9NEOP|nr:hypothetical protein PR048_020616 [Dryococelus australis]
MKSKTCYMCRDILTGAGPRRDFIGRPPANNKRRRVQEACQHAAAGKKQFAFRETRATNHRASSVRARLSVPWKDTECGSGAGALSDARSARRFSRHHTRREAASFSLSLAAAGAITRQFVRTYRGAAPGVDIPHYSHRPLSTRNCASVTSCTAPRGHRALTCDLATTSNIAPLLPTPSPTNRVRFAARSLTRFSFVGIVQTRCRWSAVFLGYLPPPPHPSPRFTVIGSQDLSILKRRKHITEYLQLFGWLALENRILLQLAREVDTFVQHDELLYLHKKIINLTPIHGHFIRHKTKLRRVGVESIVMWACPFSDWLHETLETGLVSDWPLRAGKGSLLAGLPSGETLAQSLPSTVTADNQSAVDIGISVHKTVEYSQQVIELANFSGLACKDLAFSFVRKWRATQAGKNSMVDSGAVDTYRHVVCSGRPRISRAVVNKADQSSAATLRWLGGRGRCSSTTSVAIRQATMRANPGLPSCFYTCRHSDIQGVRIACPRKPGDQRHPPARFPSAKIRGDRNRLASLGGEPGSEGANKGDSATYINSAIASKCKALNLRVVSLSHRFFVFVIFQGRWAALGTLTKWRRYIQAGTRHQACNKRQLANSERQLKVLEEDNIRLAVRDYKPDSALIGTKKWWCFTVADLGF